MNVTMKPFQANGTVFAPPSKSDAHRAIICAALSGGVCTIAPIALSDDIRATIGCVEALGATSKIENKTLTIDGTGVFSNKTAILDCGESGSTLRFMIPVAAAGGVEATFLGRGRLPERPIGVYTEALPEKGVTVDTEGGLPLKISGQLKSGVYRVPGSVSSQFITGLLFALPLLKGDSDIILTSPIQSAGYINMTIRTMAKFGVEVDILDNGWHIRGRQHYVPSDYTTDGDWSQAAFFLVAGAVSGDVEVLNANIDSAQGDRRIAALLREFGAEVIQDGDRLRVKRSPMTAIDIDASQIPDLVPVLAVCACFANGVTRITNAERLRIKESDRLKTTAQLINSLGGKVKELPDGLEITGVGKLYGGFAEGCGDHRIVMSAAVCASGAAEKIKCTDAMSINKSYPDFFEDYAKIGGTAELSEV
ncbi:MAG: 3-phosphoshikimate 1-carboxyvinyltransferase [Ruminococcus sp.]|nr:3-phosphoshikimate 1-carboxyvinyltransferase [Ruminococcus sp.]